MHIVEEIEIIKDNDKYGLKNNLKGEIILEPTYDFIEKWEHSHSYYLCSGGHDVPDIPDMYVIIKDKKIGFANENGVVVKPTYDNLLDEQFIYSEKLYPVFVAELDGYYAYIDKYGKQLTDFIYKDIQFPLLSSIAMVLNKDEVEEYISLPSGKTIFSNTENKEVIASTTLNHIAIQIEGKRYKVFDKEGNVVADFINNEKLNSAPIRYLNDKLLMYYSETEVGSSRYKIGLIDYSGKVLSDMKYSDVKAISGSSVVLCTNLVGGLDELVDSNGTILLSRMKNAISWNGQNNDEQLILPLCYWNENDDPTDIDKCIDVDENLFIEKQ